MSEAYGGDEVNAIVVDTGSMWTRIGLAGALGPTVTLPSHFCETDGARSYGDAPLLVPKPHREIRSPLTDSLITDWDAAEGIWKKGFEECGIDAQDAPIMFTEQSWNTSANRTKTLELALEGLQTPAVYLMNSAVASLFAAGRGTGLVVDAGHQTVSVTPVVDGLPLYKPLRRSRKAGSYLDGKIRELIGSPTPVFKVASRDPFVEREIEVTQSFTDFHSLQIVQDFKESMVEVPVEDEDQQQLQEPAQDPAPRAYEYPDGHTVEYAKERTELGEKLFEDGEDDVPMEEPQFAPWSAKGVSSLVIDAIKACDVDLRSNLANNIVVTGGTSLTQRFTERISADASRAFAGLKVRIHAPGSFLERKNSAWIGGSIVGSLGTFHQLWVSKEEYTEVGGEQLVKRRFM